MSADRSVAAFLGEVPLFASCRAELFDELAAQVTEVFVASGSILYRQGEPASGMAIVRRGRLEMFVETDAGEHPAASAGPGAVLGELALLTGTTRSATVRAVRDSEVLTIERAAFEHLLEREPAFALAVARNVSTRLQASVDRTLPTRAPTVLALVATEPDSPFDAVAGALAGAAGPDVGCVDEPDIADPDRADAEYTRILDRAETRYRIVLLLARGAESAWAKFCFRCADRTVVLATASPSSGLPGGLDLALCGVPVRAIPRWLDAARPHAHHLLRPGSGLATDVARMARRLTGRAVGLVLSGGGARGLAHLGVLERLHERGIELDAVAGTSIGGFVAAMVGLGWEPAQMLACCRRELVDARPFRDYTLPRVSLIHARRARAMLGRTFGAATLESLARPTLVISSDLDSGEVVVHDRGSVAHAVGASMSIPGLAPPLAYQGRMLVDGGLLDNLPVDALRDRTGGPVIAIDVMRHFEARVSQTPPSIVETMTRATFLGSRIRAAESRARADVLIEPDVAGISLLQFDRLDEAVRAGRRAADAAFDAGAFATLDPSSC